MNSLEWEVFKRTGKIEHYLLLKETENSKIDLTSPIEFSEELISSEATKAIRED